MRRTDAGSAGAITTSEPGDRWEREADEMAKRALSSAAPAALSLAGAPPPPILRECSVCAAEEEERPAIARRAADTAPASSATADPASALSSLSEGAPLPRAERAFFEPRFGFDFSSVRVHTGARADDAARSVGARAFAADQDLVFARGEYEPESKDGRQLLAHELAHVVQAQRAPAKIFREIAGGGGGDPGQMETGGGLLIDDDATTLAPGQMRKTQFLEQVRSGACAAADAQLKKVGRDTEGCPFVGRWLDFYRDRPAAHLERAVHKYAPDAKGATSAREYVAPVIARVRAGVDRWIESGELPEMPEGMGLGAGLLGGLLGGALGGLAQLFFKTDGSGPHAIQAPLALSAGRPLDSATRSRMQGAFDTDFGGVRVHTEPAAQAASRRFGARAFTVGQEIGFWRVSISRAPPSATRCSRTSSRTSCSSGAPPVRSRSRARTSSRRMRTMRPSPRCLGSGTVASASRARRCLR